MLFHRADEQIYAQLPHWHKKRTLNHSRSRRADEGAHLNSKWPASLAGRGSSCCFKCSRAVWLRFVVWQEADLDAHASFKLSVGRYWAVINSFTVIWFVPPSKGGTVTHPIRRRLAEQMALKLNTLSWIIELLRTMQPLLFGVTVAMALPTAT